MRRLSLFLRVAFVVVGLVAAACGKKATPLPPVAGSCPNNLPFTVGYLPAGFSSQRQSGPVAGKPSIKDVSIFHYTGAGGHYIEILRGGRRTQLNGSVGMIVLNHLARIGPISGGYAINVRLGPGHCALYQILSNETNDKAQELVKVGHGLKPTAGQ